MQTMSQMKSILLAIELATRRRDEYAKSLASSRRTHGFAQDQMAQLQGYAQDTDARFIGSTTVILSAELIRHHYQFVERLQQAITLQTSVLENSNRQIGQIEKALLEAEFRLAGLNHILKARQAALQLIQKRREQRATDEFASMQHARTKARALSGETL
jgi:flagellar FliJ protein